jgi:hypothetical protein
MTRQMLVAGLVLMLCGCGKTDQQKQTEEATKSVQQGAEALQKGAEQMAKGAQAGSQQMAQGIQQMAQGFQQMAQSGAKPVDYERIKALVPEISGWTRGPVKGEQVSMPIAISRAETRYQRDEARIELEITDSALNQMFMAPISMFLSAGYSERSDDGFKRAVKVGGYPGYEEWNAGSKRGEVTAVVGNRFVVHATGHDVVNIDDVRKAVESVELSKVAHLK